MRAIYIKDQIYNTNELVEVRDENYNHLARVCRLEVNENVKVLNGQGDSFITTCLEISKKSLVLRVDNAYKENRKFNVDVCLGLPKKEAFELCLKNAVEIGIGRIFPFISQYSQWKIKNFDRIDSLIESAMIQSNNPFYLIVDEPHQKLETISPLLDGYDTIVLASVKNGVNNDKKYFKPDEKILIVIGPEGGFSEVEEDFFLNNKKCRVFNSMGPILRTPNALSVTAGFVLGNIVRS